MTDPNSNITKVSYGIDQSVPGTTNKVVAELETGDIEIGAVEIKDGTTDVRQNVTLDSAKNAAFVQSESLAQESGGNLDTIAGDTTSIDGKVALAANQLPDGHNVTVDNTGLDIAKGTVSGTTFIHKFGAAPDFDTADGEVTVWDGADDSKAWQNMAYDYSTSADIQYISSTDNGDTQTIEVQGLDSNWDLVTQTKALTGQTSATLDTALIRVFRMKNVNSTDLAGSVFCSTSAAGAGGIPTAANIRAVIQIGNNQTEMAVYTIPNGKTGYMRGWYAATAGANKTSNYIMRLKARPTGAVFQLKHRSSLSDTGTSAYQHAYSEPEVHAAKTDIEMTAEMTAGGGSGAAVSAGFDIVLVDD